MQSKNTYSQNYGDQNLNLVLIMHTQV